MVAKGRHAIEARLARIEGHLHAVHTMTHQGKGYPEIVHQIAAVRSSLDSVLQAIVEDLADTCVHTASTPGTLAPAVEELCEVVTSAL
jgi:DNA-binding FrmR family transcriptional regulator